MFAPSYRPSMRSFPARSTPTPPVINRIMLRFRPIAPKPVGSGAISGAADQNKSDLTGRRVKRKYVRVRGRQTKRRPKREKLPPSPSPPEKSGVEDAPPPEEETAPLQLLGDRSEIERKICENNRKEADLDNGVKFTNTAVHGGSEIESLVVLESVTETFAGVGLGFSELEKDTCPGFVSDWRNKVIWVNSAYKKMVVGEEEEEREFLVRLVVKERIPHFCPSFACRVKVSQREGEGQKWNKIVPCDVWRIGFVGFAWKLDVNTALSLGF